jgi:GH15 family glucan-1,4-alpha-glucosidase
VYKKISDYGIIGNLQSVALIGLDGSIDWMCLPHMDSPSVFAALLDDCQGGRFSISPAGEWDSVADYLPGTNILVTQFRTRDGLLRLTDFMPIVTNNGEKRRKGRKVLYRLAEVLQGKVSVRLTFEPRFDYARAKGVLEKHKSGLFARGKDQGLTLASTHELEIREGRGEAEWDLSEGARVWLHLRDGAEEPAEVDIREAEQALRETEAYWQNWLRKAETGQTIDSGPYQGLVERSALVLKLLYYDPAGTIAAAATTSLPEEIGGGRNWDYRYTWLRDSSFTLQALFSLGHLSETRRYLKWIEKLIAEHGAQKLQIMYGLHGERDLPEQELPHLEGYKGSRPVRIGNGAANQRQLDIYGEVMDAALKLSQYAGKIDAKIWPNLRSICNYVMEHWAEKDSGIWEVRCGPYHFVYSKVMCWVALDRGITIARRYGFPADLGKWESTRLRIKREALEKGWNEGKKAFVQHYDTDALDASNLLMPILGFLPFEDPRIISTIEAIREELGKDGFLYRYLGEDGLSGREGTFLLCSFWLAQNWIGLGRLEEAENLLRPRAFFRGV